MIQQNLIFDSLLNNYTLYDYDNNGYTSVIIGTQEWTVQNLRTTHYADGVLIPYINGSTAWVNDASGAYCEYDNSIGVYVNTYGYLYNWYAVDNSNGLVYFKRNGMYESGWRVPSTVDCSILRIYLGATAGGKLKEIGLTHWISPNVGATNETGFSAFASGARDNLASFLNYAPGVGYFLFHTTTERDATYVYYDYIQNISTNLFETYGEKIQGFSIRCVKDST